MALAAMSPNSVRIKKMGIKIMPLSVTKWEEAYSTARKRTTKMKIPNDGLGADKENLIVVRIN